MRIAVVQMKPVFGDKLKNIDRIIDLINNTDSDIIVFPELCTTGYFFRDREEVAAFAEPFGGKTISKVQELATSLGRCIVLGFAECDGPKLYNSAAVVMPDAATSRVYRKSHLFYKEKNCFDAGDTGFFVVRWEDKDVNIGPMICYDWRFPEAARTLALRGADLIVCPANLVTKVWHISTPSRALENKVYLAVANRTGTESRNGEDLYFNGMSTIYSFTGEPLAGAGKESEEVILAEIEPAATRNKSFNSLNNIFLDRRPELYE